MGSPLVHITLSYDAETHTVVCKACGVVPAAWRVRKGGRRTPCCGPSRKKQDENSRRTKGHGLTQREATALLDGAVCAICGGDHLLGVDHCHATGNIRGVLCRRCNVGLGMFLDKPELLLKAVEYISP